MDFPKLVYGTPRKLPKPSSLEGRVVVLDIAFAADGAGSSFEKTTEPFIRGLGNRLAMWVDHHDHVYQQRFRNDSRFVLATKAEHGACPEMVTKELVARAGPIQTICCHVDFDGLCSAAKWIRGGEEPYAGADADARVIDTRIGVASERAEVIDRALRARPRDDALRGLVVRFLVDGALDAGLFRTLRETAEEFRAREDEARELSRGFSVEGMVAVVDTRHAKKPYDKTYLLLLGQQRAPVALVHDATTITVAAGFDSGIDLLQLLGIQGGMPTRVSVPADRLAEVLERLKTLA